MYHGKVGASPWTAEIDEFMRVNWTVGTSATNCANLIYTKFGVAFSRMAVIGRARRQGYKTTGSNRLGRPRDPNRIYPDSRKKRPRRTIEPRFGAPRAAIKPSPKVQPQEPIETRNMKLIDLSPHDCRYPTSPDDAISHLFCGAPQYDDGPYCLHHAQICYRATPRMTENTGSRALMGRKSIMCHDLPIAEEIVDEAPVPPPPTSPTEDLPHGKTRSEHSGSSA